MNEGIKVDNGKLTLLASFVDYKSAYSKGIVGIYSKKGDNDLLKLLTVYLNSDFIRYFSFLVTSSWGIERDVVKHKELFEAPYILEKLNEIQKKKIVNLFDEKLYSKEFYIVDKLVENEINEIILNCLYENEKSIIQHLLNNIELFHRQEKSVALYPVLQEQISEYGKIICTELNNFLDGQDLFANATTFESINRNSPLMLIKLSFSKEQKENEKSIEFIDDELKKIDKSLWEKKSQNIYFRKKLNYSKCNDIYIIRPNQRRFWSQSMALEDASELILEMLNGLHDEV